MAKQRSSASIAHKFSSSSKRRQSMVKIESFEIIFDQDGVFYAGQEVSGTIVLQLSETKKVNEILLELKGKTKTYWTKHSGKSRQHYTDSEPYFCEQFNTEYTHAYGNPKERTLPVGRHEIPFSYQLFANLPSSFEGDYGHVRYTATATLERPWDFDIICSKAFSVVGIETEDLNEHKAARDEVKIQDSEFDVMSCFRKVGSIRVDLNLSKAGYVPGETIRVNAIVTNDSNRTLKYTVARVKQHTNYRAKSFMGIEEDKQITTTIVKCEKGTVAPRSVQKWINEPLPVPPVPPKLLRCKPIDINYSLEFEVDPGLLVIAPLFIGTIPLVNFHMHESTEDLPNGQHLEHQKIPADRRDSKPRIRHGSQEGEAKKLNPVELHYPMLPKPTFEENFHGKFETWESRHGEPPPGDTKFAPRYPCYRNLKYANCQAAGAGGGAVAGGTSTVEIVIEDASVVAEEQPLATAE